LKEIGAWQQSGSARPGAGLAEPQSVWLVAVEELVDRAVGPLVEVVDLVRIDR
jgi:hypothetical protein